MATGVCLLVVAGKIKPNSPRTKKPPAGIKNVLIVKGRNQVKLFIFLVVSSLGTHFLAQRFFSYT